MSCTESFRIDGASINGIGPSRKATLQSYGIETAADITQSTILSVPGFGPSYTRKLLDWRQSIERRFVFNPSKGIDPADVQAVEREITSTRVALEQELSNGPSHLRQISNQIKMTRQSTQPAVEDAIKKLAQGEVDWKAVSSLSTSLMPVLAALGITLLVLLPLRASIDSNRANTRNVVQPVQATEPNTLPMQSQNANVGITSLADQKAIELKKSYEEGVAYTKAGRYQQAVKSYQQAITLKPDYAEAYHELGFAFYKLKKYEDAIATSKQALVLNPQNADTFNNIGLAYIALEQWEDAVKAFQRATLIKPNYAVAYYNLGLVYKRTEKNESAIASFQEVISIKPNYANAHYELALLYHDLGDQTAAMEQYITLTSIDKKLAEKLLVKITQ